MGIMENNRMMIRAIRAIRNLNPIGIPFRYTDLLNDDMSYSRYPEYDYDNMALVHAIDSLIRSKEIVKTDNKMLIRVKGDNTDYDIFIKDKVMFQKPKNEILKTLDANQTIA